MNALGPAETSASIPVTVTIDSLDHLVLTVRDAEASVAFYRDVLGMREQAFGDGRRALHFGDHKLNLHVAGEEVTPHAAAATPGSADMCLLTRTPVEGILRLLEVHGVDVEHGPVERTGATGPLLSIDLRDPDGNLVELANRMEP